MEIRELFTKPIDRPINGVIKADQLDVESIWQELEEHVLAKTEAAHVTLRDAFAQKGDIINNQQSFLGNAVNLRGYQDAAEFVVYYPFAPYQFQLLQKIFESIRKVGATGKHLSRGERSLLDAFQSAAVQNAGKAINVLIPLYDFYPSIESFTCKSKNISSAPKPTRQHRH